jgi:purine nucleosidase
MLLFAMVVLTFASAAAPQGGSPLMRSMPEGSEPLPVVLSTDCGTEIDDQWAVIYLAISRELQVLGFLGNHARNELTGEKARDTILDVLENRLEMKEHPPVFAGSDGPLSAPDKANDNEAVRFLIEQSRAFAPTERLTVLIIGSHTDVASAILADPTAAGIVFDSGVPLVVGPGEVAKRHLSFTTEECQARLRDTGKAGAWLAECFAAWPHRFEEEGRRIWPIWDNITVAYLLGFTRTVVHHRPRIAEDLSFDHSDPQGQLTWIEGVDEERMWADYVGKLKAWEGNR